MKIHIHPELLDRLAASYALGTLRGAARRRFETLTREQTAVRAAALVWQGRLSSINELLPSTKPAPEVWTRIDNLVQAQQEQASRMAARAAAFKRSEINGWEHWLGSLTVWRAVSAACVVVAVLAITNGARTRDNLSSEIAQLQNQLQAAPQVGYVAVLADDKAAASVLATFDPKNQKLTLQRVSSYREADDRSLQLWALPASGAPRSLGVLGRDSVIALTASESDVREIPALAISLEPKGGVPNAGGPTGPVLFKGALIQKLI